MVDVLHGGVLHGGVLYGDVLHGDVLHGDVLHGDVLHGDVWLAWWPVSGLACKLPVLSIQPSF